MLYELSTRLSTTANMQENAVESTAYKQALFNF